MYGENRRRCLQPQGGTFVKMAAHLRGTMRLWEPRRNWPEIGETRRIGRRSHRVILDFAASNLKRMVLFVVKSNMQ